MNTNTATGLYDIADQSWSASEIGSGATYNEIITPKEVWAGTSPERAFSQDAPWPFRRQAQIKYFGMLEKSRRTLVACIHADPEETGQWKVEPQISAFYTPFPWPARASVGHTVFLEAAELSREIINTLREHLEKPEKAQELCLLEKSYLRTASLTAQALGNRALFDMLAENPELGDVGFYRLFQASQNTLTFRRLSDVINGVVLLGDLLPSPRFLNLHPVTAQIMKALSVASHGFWQEASASTAQCSAVNIYLRWGEALMEAIQIFLPLSQEKRTPVAEKLYEKAMENLESGYREQGGRLPPQREWPVHAPDYMPPFDEPQLPRLDEPQPLLKDHVSQILNKIKKALESKNESGGGHEAPQKEEQPAIVNALNELAQAAAKASAQTTEWEDMREDIVEQRLASAPFRAGPIEGEITSGKNITREIGGKEVGGELFDRNVPLCENMDKVARLRQRAAPVAAALKRNLYPNTYEEFQAEYPRSSGLLDARRLPLAEISDAVFRRFKTKQVMDPGGRAVLLIAADASSSLSDDQMQMCKYLFTAWLDSIPSNRMQVLAAFYHSGTIRSCVKGPLVQWVYHPQKTPVYTPRDAVRAVASLPDSGSGAQSDALSLTYLLDEAAALSHGAHVYLTLISDCAFNRSFDGTGLCAEDEIAEVIATSRKQLDSRLHITLVALESRVSEIIQNAVDAVIPVDKSDLKNPARVAETVGAYVASCVRSRIKQIQRV